MACHLLSPVPPLLPHQRLCRGSNAPTEFTIHGLWPNYNDGTWPACCTKKSFDEKEVSTLLGALEKYWPTYGCFPYITCDGSNGSFWAHERSMGLVPLQLFGMNTITF
ncbi:ribonuclease 2 [Cannabis sativa]|uniref:ribonuclease 2 n=1 Tax=Cannabis sativa TaxID=3483 RepID=UPI0029CA1B29|nr:ribonuclease 2 [Cannabis sativa]